MKKFLGINLNKNLAKKGTTIALALAVVIGMSYFGSKDYLNMSIMDMLMGQTTQHCCSNCNQSATNQCNASNCTHNANVCYRNQTVYANWDVLSTPNSSSSRSSPDGTLTAYYDSQGVISRREDPGHSSGSPYNRPHTHYYRDTDTSVSGYCCPTRVEDYVDMP